MLHLIFISIAAAWRALRVLSGEADQGVCVPLEPGGVATCATVRPVSDVPAAGGRL